MKKWLFILTSLFASFAFGNAPDNETHEFSGKHFFGSYTNCDKSALGDVEGMLAAMDKAVLASGATILDRTHYVFPPNGLTVVYLLSESHASIHTYPEYGACFVDLFTCGDHCSPVGFDQILREYLQPEDISARLFLRHDGVEEVPVHNF